MRDEYDFSTAKRAKDVPHLAKLQAEHDGKVGHDALTPEGSQIAAQGRAGR